MKSKIPVVIGTLFLAYIAFVAVVVLVYKPNPEDMSWEDRQAYNQGKLTELKLGQSGESVVEMLGHPDFSEAKLSQGQTLNVLFYRTHQTKSDGVTTKDECTPLLFRNDQLIAWGDDTYQQYLQQVTDTEPQPVRDTAATATKPVDSH
ncbi:MULTISPECIES: DUF3192 domain-containing protein [Shewanella]|jgi:hypothetical protein|uniref:DUF3192 domain-containing protein n=1 Tax=Shewanella TaxID=22 RepID=UPI001678D5B1|nr:MULTISPECIES: DUF3192 domain-containing protein [Shewanella]MBO1270399.1 DUF3192 domain-containing protein [Shewanella sp. 4t3-1-2LB]MCL2908124.1 DUF3192 domain-containing protein [Shewanella fodinae]GGZ13424.1 DUF3192 domain-containing protein [Shewanella fodinae]